MSFPDFSASDAHVQWQRFNNLLWYHNDLGIWLDISRMHINAEDFERLGPRFDQAFKAMQALEQGSIANADEQRMVGHYWLRQPQLAPDQEVRDHIAKEIDLIETFGSNVVNGLIKAPNGKQFTDVLWIGIGGSGLGPLLMIRALQNAEQGLRFHFFDNVDPDGMSRVLGNLGDALSLSLIHI